MPNSVLFFLPDNSESKYSKTFKNSEFGFTRVTIERPLRLRYQMTIDDKARFLDAFPHLLDDLQAIDKELGREPYMDWNDVDKRIRKLLKKNESKWNARENKLFRDVFTKPNPEAKKVLKNKNEFEPDAELRDNENIPLDVNIEQYFQHEVLTHIPDAWMDRTKDKVGYELTFNRYFFNLVKPRDLKKIDIDLKKVEDKILQILNELTE